MAFKKWITGIFWWRKTTELEKLIEKQQQIIKELGESSKEIGIPNKKQEETIEKFKNEIREINNILEKERERASSLEGEIRKQQRISDKLKEEIERKTSLITEYEESAKTFKDKLDEVNNRYQKAIERLEKEKQTNICLEMLILDLDKELGLLDIVAKIAEEEEKIPEITIKNLVTYPRVHRDRRKY